MATGADKKRAEHGSKPRRATKRDMAKRDLRLIEQLAAGVTIEEIAASEGISVQWARERKAAILAKRVARSFARRTLSPIEICARSAHQFAVQTAAERHKKGTRWHVQVAISRSSLRACSPA